MTSPTNHLTIISLNGVKKTSDKDNLIGSNDRPKKNAGNLLIKSCRQWFDGRRNWHLVAKDFKQFFGCSLGQKITSRLDELLGDMESHAKRPLLIQPPGKDYYGPDEIIIHQIIAAIQGSQFHRADRLIENMICLQGHGAIADGFFMLARYFTIAGHFFPMITPQEREDEILYLRAAE